MTTTVPDATLIGSEWTAKSGLSRRRIAVRACEWRNDLPYYLVQTVPDGRHSWILARRLPKVYRMVRGAGR